MLFAKLKEGLYILAKPFIEKYPAEFIQGLADSEGCPVIGAGKKFSCGVNVAYSTHLELLEYVRWLLSDRFSINSRVVLCKKKGIVDSVIGGRKIRRTKSLYCLKIGANKDVKDFHEKIGFSLERKQQKLDYGLRIIERFDVVERTTSWKEKYRKEGRRWVRN